ncbi:MAG TPA: hemerythrin domain-containing protein [Actinocrinis sp.]|nr:hemerythrin domain-containing protein [Actinocrinis sp.]
MSVADQHPQLAEQQLPADSVIAVLLQQHARIRRLFTDVNTSSGAARQAAFDQLRELLAVHEAGEEAVLRPVSRSLLGKEQAAARNQEEHQAAQTLAALETLDVHSRDFTALFGRLEMDVATHAALEESEEFPAIVDNCSAQEQEKLGRRLLNAEKSAPTHAHPNVLGSTGSEHAVGPFAALLDKVRDYFARTASGKRER